MHSPARLAGVVVLCCLALTACGDEGSPAVPSPSQSVAEPATAPPTGPKPTPTGPPAPAFPMTVTRTGGIVGFNDTLTLSANGAADVTSSGRSGTCTVEATLLGTIKAAAAKIDWRTMPAKPPKAEHPDDLVIAVSAGGGTVRLNDPRVKALNSPLSSLIADATAPAAKRKYCKS
ncbi:MAG TPA: hypothetical protein VGJ44_16290 [Kribbellaceae bacterium]